MRGRLRSIIGTDPAANVEIVETVPAGKRWRIIAFTFKLVTGATAGGRQPAMILDDGVNIFAVFGSNHNQVNGITESYSFVQEAALRGQIGASVTAMGGTNAWGDAIPNGDLAAGYRIRTTTVFVDAADNYGPPTYLVEEWDA